MIRKNVLVLFGFLVVSITVDAQREIGIDFPVLGEVKHRDVNEIGSSNWLIGCETLDRDYTDYDQYKSMLVPLGINRIRLQAGWAKIEKQKGIYDWTWLDHIINDATSRGLNPWLQLSYGNSIYEGGGGINLAAGVPHSEIALSAWDKWVVAIVSRYKEKVDEWEIWNEPNFGDNAYNTPDKAAALHIRTIDVIKSIQPDAKVSGLAIGHIDLEYADEFFKILNDSARLALFDYMTYHDYVYNPDSHYSKVLKLKSVLEKYNKTISLRQGENGAPSLARMGGALGDYDWTELSQAKWVTRRMLGDLGHDIETSLFTIIDIPYKAGPITKLNAKGLIQSDSTMRAIRPKLAYSAVQNVVSIFDNSLIRIKRIRETYNSNLVPKNSDEILVNKGTDRDIVIYGFMNNVTKLQLFAIWNKECIPNNVWEKREYNITFINANIKEPVYVDIITGKVFYIPAENWSKENNKYVFNKVPVYDGPVLIADKSLISIEK